MSTEHYFAGAVGLRADGILERLERDPAAVEGEASEPREVLLLVASPLVVPLRPRQKEPVLAVLVLPHGFLCTGADLHLPSRPLASLLIWDRENE